MSSRMDSQGARRPAGRASSWAMLVFATVAAIVAVIALPGGSATEQASEPGNIAAAQIDAGQNHSCALQNGQVRCWGFNREGQLGLGHTNTIGDNETANAAPPVDLGPGRTAIALSAGDFHTCVILV